MIKVILSDMDGTLLDENGKLPQGFAEIMVELKKRNVKFIPTSGRQYYSLLNIFADYADDMIFLAENGNYAVSQDGEIFSNKLKPEDIKGVWNRCKELPEAFPVFCGKKGAYVTPEWEPYINEAYKIFERIFVIHELSEIDDEIVKIAIGDCLHFDCEQNIYPHLLDLGDHLQICISSRYWIDMMNLGANKGMAVKRLQDKLGVKPDECAAFGDYLNDYEMLQQVTYSYAMHNAHPKLKKVAAFVADSNCNYGVITAIRSMMDRGMI